MVEVQQAQTLNRTLATVGWGALLIWWGVVIMFDPITIGMGAIGMGLILLGVNAGRLLSGIPTKGSTTAVGVVAVAWGALDQALALSSGASFAMLLIVIGVVMLVSLLVHQKAD